MNPKPVRDRHIPVVFGGNGDAALKRVATVGNRWYGFNLAGVDAVRERLSRLEELCHESGRSLNELKLAVSLQDGDPSELATLSALGISELVLVDAPPEDPHAAASWIAGLTARWGAVVG